MFWTFFVCVFEVFLNVLVDVCGCFKNNLEKFCTVYWVIYECLEMFWRCLEMFWWCLIVNTLAIFSNVLIFFSFFLKEDILKVFGDVLNVVVYYAPNPVNSLPTVPSSSWELFPDSLSYFLLATHLNFSDNSSPFFRQHVPTFQTTVITYPNLQTIRFIFPYSSSNSFGQLIFYCVQFNHVLGGGHLTKFSIPDDNAVVRCDQKS